MGKIYGLFGSMTGKVADVVMAVRNGEQIVRKYQPIVSNPSTSGQLESRAKLKMMSQLSAVLGPTIAIPRVGTRSPRNLFVQKNYLLASYANNQASITLEGVQLTDSAVGFPSVARIREENAIRAYIAGGQNLDDIDQVVYVALSKGADNKLRMLGTAVATSVGTGYPWAVELPLTDEEVVIYAYGVRINSETARAKFGNIEAMTAETIAKLVVTRSVASADITLTETRGITLAATNPSNAVSQPHVNDENRTSAKKK